MRSKKEIVLMSESKSCGAASPSEASSSASLITPAVAELIAVAAAVTANCEPCFKLHYAEASKLGVSRDDVAQAVALADRVKRAPAANMLALADKLLGTHLATQPPAPPPAACCAAEAS
jgi:AhpD family alkylhydroperoxidase